MTSPRTHWAQVLRSYLLRGEAGLADLEERVESTAHDRPNRKFSKDEAIYLPQSPFPPTMWRTSCGRCRFWEEGEPGEPGKCHIVGREGDPFGGEAIHYRGWCAYWMPPAGEPPFAWVRERLRPDGRSSVRGVYDPELTERERRRKQRDREKTSPDAPRAAVTGGDGGGQASRADENGTGGHRGDDSAAGGQMTDEEGSDDGT